MKKEMKKLLLLALVVLSMTLQAQVKIGDNPTTIGASSLLELESTNKGVVLPRVANTAAITTPVNGMMIYDISSNCAKVYENGVWSVCLSSTGAAQPTLVVDATQSGFSTEDFIMGIANVATNTYSVRIVNNSFYSTTLSFAKEDLVLGGSNANLTVSAVSQPSATLNAGGSVIITYTIAGTPSTTGDLTAAWSKLTLSHSGTTTVKNKNSLITYAGSYTGNFYTMTVLNSSVPAPSYKLLITNNATRSLSFPAPVIGNVIPNTDGDGNPAVTVSAVAPTVAFAVAAGATSTITYTLACASPFITAGDLNTPCTYNGQTLTDLQPISWLEGIVDSSNSVILNGTYIVGVPMVPANNYFQFTMTNNNSFAINNITKPLANNLTINNGTSMGLIANTPVPNTNFDLAANTGTRNIRWSFGGTPTVAGDIDLQMNYVNGDFVYNHTIPVKTVTGYLNTTPVFVYTGNYVKGTSLTGHTVRVTIKNNTATTTPSLPAPTIGNLSFNGLSGLTVSSVSPTVAYTLAAGDSTTFIYTLSGAPPVGTNNLDISWTYGGATLNETKSLDTMESFFNADYADSAIINGTMLSGTAFGATNTFTVSLTNTSAATVNMPALASTNLQMAYTGTANPAIGVSTTVSPSGAFTIGAGATKLLTYTITGTPTSQGTLSGSWNYAGLSADATRVIGPVATITGLTCASATHSGTLIRGVLVTGSAVTTTLPYTGGNGGSNPQVSVASTGVTGLTAKILAGTIANGDGNFTVTITGTPAASGTASFSITIGGKNCVLTRTVEAATISTLDCAGVVHNATILVRGKTTASCVTTLPYTGGNGGTYTAVTATSTGVTGLTATIAAGTLAAGDGNFTVTITGTPVYGANTTANASFAMTIGGKTCTFVRSVTPSVISTLACGSATHTGTLYVSNSASGVSSTLPYTGGNGGSFPVHTATSTGVTGLTMTISAGNTANGSGSFTANFTGTPNAGGTATFSFSILGKTCTFTRTVNPDAIRAALVIGGCASCAAYDAAAVDDVVKVTAAEFNALSETVPGITNFGRKAADDGKIVGNTSYTNKMFIHNIPVGAYPFAFTTLMGTTSSAGVKLIKQERYVGATSNQNYNSGACYSGSFTAGLHYFVLKRPSVAMIADINIAVKGYNYGWGSGSGGNGIDGVPPTYTYSLSPTNETSTTCSVIAESNVATLAATTGGSYAAAYLNYSIKWTATKSW